MKKNTDTGIFPRYSNLWNSSPDEVYWAIWCMMTVTAKKPLAERQLRGER